MIGHLYKNKLKILLKRKSMLFWTLAFPFVLGTFFYLALGNIGKEQKLDIIPIAVVETEEYLENNSLKTMIDSLSQEGENQIFKTQYTKKDDAEYLLDKEEIEGYIFIENNEPKLVIKQNGINQTIIKYVLNQYYQMNNVVEQLIEYNPKIIYSGILELLTQETNILKDTSVEKVNFSINYFFTLIAMTCLYSSLIGLEIIKDCEANLSPKGARVSISPINKFKIIITDLLAGYTIELGALFLLYLYLIYILNINFGSNILATIIITAVGSLGGLTLGTFIGVSNKKNENFKMGFLISTIMALCFLSGMMGSPELRVTIDENLPLLRLINPVHIISDGLYSLFAYDTLSVYLNCLLRISIFTIIMIILTYIMIRRKNYDSI